MSAKYKNKVLMPYVSQRRIWIYWRLINKNTKMTKSYKLKKIPSRIISQELKYAFLMLLTDDTGHSTELPVWFPEGTVFTVDEKVSYAKLYLFCSPVGYKLPKRFRYLIRKDVLADYCEVCERQKPVKIDVFTIDTSMGKIRESYSNLPHEFTPEVINEFSRIGYEGGGSQIDYINSLNEHSYLLMYSHSDAEWHTVYKLIRAS